MCNLSDRVGYCHGDSLWGNRLGLLDLSEQDNTGLGYPTEFEDVDRLRFGYRQIGKVSNSSERIV